MGANNESPIEIGMIMEMVYEDNRLKSFTKCGLWPFSKDSNCTPEKMAGAGFYWCGSKTQPDLVRCFVCLKEFEDWEANDNPREEHKRLCPQCPFMKLGKTQDNCTVKEVMELCQKGLTRIADMKGSMIVEQYSSLASDVRKGLESLGKENHLNSCE